MPISQNVRCVADSGIVDEVELIELLSQRFAEFEWQISKPDWVDLVCEKADQRLQILIAKLYPRSEWMLQISAVYQPGLIGWLLGKPPSATPENIFLLANDVHAILSQTGFSEFKWCWDGPPEDDTSTPTPTSTEKQT